MSVLTALLAGVVFGLGLLLAGMANPAKVLGFLDLAGRWDPSLAFVMGGAIAVGFFAFAFAKNRTQSFLGLPMQMPTAHQIDRRLLAGGTLFGVGWGLAGVCPGPALVLVGAGEIKGLVFFATMLVGMWGFEVYNRFGQR